MTRGPIVVVGASSGGVRALQFLASQLAAGFPAPILVVQHIGSNPSLLPTLLMRHGPLPAAHAVDQERVAASRFVIAPPDHHMLLDGDVIRLSRGPKEHHTRPAIDPLFRSAAVSWGPAVIGVLLTGFLDDGTAGLQAIKRCGGTVVVQDPADAETPSMPLSAVRFVDVDHVVPLDKLGELLQSLVAQPARLEPANEPAVVHENEIFLGRGNPMEHLNAIAKPSTFVCPDCDGALWELEGARPKRFRCHTGHGYTLRSLQHAQEEQTDMALWSAFRALQEKELLLKTLASDHREAGESEDAERLDAEARALAVHGETLRVMIQKVPPAAE